MRLKREFEAFTETAFSAYADCERAALAYTGDGGTCNFDFVVLKMRYGSKEAAAILNRIGLRAYLHKRGEIHVSTPFGGQAMRRTVAVEAICNAFRKAELPGVEAYVYYLTD